MHEDARRLNLSREEIAQIEIGHTDISRPAAWLLILAFLVTLGVPPIAQLVNDIFMEREPRFRNLPPSGLQFLTALPKVGDAFVAANGNQLEKLAAANRESLVLISDYDDQLENRSLLTRGLIGPVREFLVLYGGKGSDRVTIGSDGWVFYQPDIEYVTGPGFLDPRQLIRRARTQSQEKTAVQPDPRQAIIEFHQQLAARSIRLIILPTPGKPSIYPEQLSGRLSIDPVPLQNESFEQFQRDMQAAGVLVFDTDAVLAEVKRTQGSLDMYLRTDTHWTPAAVDTVAARLRDFIERESILPPVKAMDFRRQPLPTSNLGDTAKLLRLPERQTLFPVETVTLSQVALSTELPDLKLWQQDPNADVLLLGDSFTNIYSLPELNWGSAAGLAEQISFHLGRGVDRIAQNDGGAFAARQSLMRDIARGHDRLAGKRVVIWQFACRELAFGDWKLMAMPTVEKPAVDGSDGIAAADSTVIGTVQAAATVPRPGSVPYREAVMSSHLVDVESRQGPEVAKEIVIYCWGMKQNQQTNAARWTTGQRVSLRLTPWESARRRFERFNRVELDDPDFSLIQLPLYWAEELTLDR